MDLTVDQVMQDLSSLRRYLSARERCSEEVALYLRKKGVLENDVRIAVVFRLVSLGLINDRRFARNRAHYRSSQGYGPVYVKRELSRLRIPRDIIHELMNETPEADHVARAFDMASSRLPSLIHKDNARRRLIQYLLGRGFTPGQVEKTLSRLMASFPHWARRTRTGIDLQGNNEAWDDE